MRHRVFGYALLGVILGSPLLLTGGNEVLFTVLLGLTLLLSFLFLLKQPIDGALKIPLRLFLAFIGCQLLTLIPIPVAWIRWLSPGLHKVLLNFPEVAYHTLSWDAILTMKTLAIYVAAAGVFLVAYHLWEDPLEKVPFVVQLFFWTGTFWVAVSLWLHFTTPGRVPFLPWQSEPWFFGLFTNENIFGAYCAMLIPLGLALGIYRIKTWNAAPGIAPVIHVGAALLGYALWISKSQGAIIAVSLVILCYMLPKRFITIPVLLAGLAFVLILAGPTLGGNAFASLKERLSFSGIALRSLATMPFPGSGLGTAELVLPRFQGPIGDKIVNKVHNDIMELILTSGLAAFLALMAIGLVGLVAMRFYRRRYILRAGLAGSLLTIGIHSLVDFPLQNITILSIIMFTGGILTSTHDQEDERGFLLKEYVVFLVLMAGALGVTGLSIEGIARNFRNDISIWQPERSLSHFGGEQERMTHFLHHHGLQAAAWGALSLNMEHQNRFEEALESIEKAIALQPWNPRLLIIHARLCFYSDDRTRMMQDLIQAFAWTGPSVLIDFPLSNEEVAKITKSGAEKAYQYYGDKAYAFYREGYYYLQQYKIEAKHDLIIRAQELFPDQEMIQNTVAVELLESGHPNQALNAAMKAWRLNPRSYNAALMGRAFATLGRETDSLNAFVQGLDTAVTGDEASMVVSWMSSALASMPASTIISFARRGYVAFPQPGIAALIAREYRRDGNPRQAADWYGKALLLAPEDKDLYKEFLPLLIEMGESQHASLIEHQFKSHFPKDPWLEQLIKHK